MNGQQPRFLLEPEAIQLVEAYGLPYASHGLARSAEEAVTIADGLGYPVVLKVVSPDIVHKSDAGGVVVGLMDKDAVTDAYDQILTTVTKRVPGSDIEGILVCKQAPPGLEVIVGGLKDELFGPTVIFGLGGVFVEVLEDVAFRVAPLKRRDAEEMIREIRGYRLLTGARGRQDCDTGALADALISVSRLMVENRDIAELDLNPVRLYQDGLLVLDARAMKQGS